MDCVAQQRAVTMCRESFRNAVRRGSVRSFDLLPSSLNQPKQTHACRMYDVIISHPHLLLPLLPLHYECAAPPSNAVLVFARHAEFARPRRRLQRWVGQEHGTSRRGASPSLLASVARKGQVHAHGCDFYVLELRRLIRRPR
eukprot:scaffold164328_cov32-Tisochrysis_lutea.AAC.1